MKQNFENPLNQDLELYLWIVQTKFDSNSFNSFCSIPATDLGNMVSRKMRLNF